MHPPDMPSYLAKLLEAHAAGKFPRGTVSQVLIAHDDDCPSLRTEPGPCHCDATVRIVAEAPTSA